MNLFFGWHYCLTVNGKPLPPEHISRPVVVYLCASTLLEDVCIQILNM